MDDWNNKKQPLTKENWAALTTEEKTKELQRVLPGADYQYFLDDYNLIKEFDSNSTLLCEWEHPVLVLKLIDPVMATQIMTWMYRQGEKLANVPFFGYSLEEIHFDKDNLPTFSESEKEIIKEAIKILNKNFNNKENGTGEY